MKKKYYLLFIITLLLNIGFTADGYAQGRSKQGGPPPWAPAHGYRAKTRHIYFPQHNFYFDMQRGIYIYLSGGSWITAVKLPSLFGRVDLTRATQIELDFSDDNPHRYNKDHQAKFKGKPQATQVKTNAAGPPPPPKQGGGNGNGNGNGNNKGGGKGKKN